MPPRAAAALGACEAGAFAADALSLAETALQRGRRCCLSPGDDADTAPGLAWPPGQRALMTTIEHMSSGPECPLRWSPGTALANSLHWRVEESQASQTRGSPTAPPPGKRVFSKHRQ